MRTVVENRKDLHEIHKFDDKGFVYANEHLPPQRSCFYDFGTNSPAVSIDFSAEPVSDFAESLKTDFYG